MANTMALSIESFLEIINKIKDGIISFEKDAFKYIMRDYRFYYISEKSPINTEEEEEINDNITNSKIIIIDQIEQLNQSTKESNYIIGFEKTIIILEHSLYSYLHKLISINIKVPVCFLSNNKEIFTKENQIKNPEIICDQRFKTEIKCFIQKFCFLKSTEKVQQVWQLITPCISSYLIKKSYLQLKKNRIETFCKEFEKNSFPEIMSEEDYIELRDIGIGSIFKCVLIYHIKKGKLYAIKKPNTMDYETEKLQRREIDNYKQMCHPFIPKYYGTVKSKGNKEFIVIEYINGESLNNINKMNLSDNDRIIIIFELMIIFDYFHVNDFIYRDLKPDNIIIDENKTVILIDFDRLIKNNDDSINTNQTLNFSSEFCDPMISETVKFSHKSDIYSIGKIFEYLIDQTNLMKNSKLNEIFSKCLNKIAEDRPLISNLIEEFISVFHNAIQIENYCTIYDEFFYFFRNINHILKSHEIESNNPKELFSLGKIYFKEIFIQKDINKAIHYYSLAANQNNQRAPFSLGFIYEKGADVSRDINKAIHYYSLAANQNDPIAQFRLGFIYIEGRYVKQDINKAIHYFTLAANQNDPDAQFLLGSIYHGGRYITSNINKAIHYYSLAANHNHTKAQYNLGVIYRDGQYMKRDIGKALYYLSMAANQNFLLAQFDLGVIYGEGKYVTRDIEKSICYLSLAANQNDSSAQFLLGNIYYEGQYIQPNIEKAIHYYTLASNQNHLEAQFILGKIYYEGKYIQANIDKAIHYYLLAANQNHLEALFNLGTIYIEGKYISRDIDKAIHYYLLAANQNEMHAQYNLGLIYLNEQYGKQNISKAIYYLSLSANQHFSPAQFILGIIYFNGKYVTHNIKKSILYFSLAADQNDPKAQFILGSIYYEGYYTKREIDKAIYYFQLAANHNHPGAQTNLGFIYLKGEYISPDINKANHYFSLAANQNEPQALFNLCIFYYEGQYVPHNINSAFHYFSLAANLHHSRAQFNIGLFYQEGKYIPKDINKAIYYYTLAANKNDPRAQFNLGLIYYLGQSIRQDIKKGLYYIELSSKNKNEQAHFACGFLHHEGKHIKKDIKKAIHYYKKASSLNNPYAKNNLGIIYKHGYDSNKGNAISLFEEAIRQKNDYLSKYNLAHMYLYDETIKHDINQSIDLLIGSSNFVHSLTLLILVLIKKVGFNIEKIKQEIEQHVNLQNDLPEKIYKILTLVNSFDDSDFEYNYELYRSIDFLYDIELTPILTSDFNKTNSNTSQSKYQKSINISSEFYKGFEMNI